MKTIFIVLALCAIAYGKDITQDAEMVPLDGALKDLLNTKHFKLTGSRQVDTESVGEVSEANRNFVVDTITNLIEGLRDVVINGNDDLPPLDPLQVEQLGPVTLGSGGTRLTVELRSVNLEGLRWYVLNDVTFSTLRLALGLSFTLPRIVITGDYTGDARFLFIPYTARGDFRLFIHRIEVDVELRLGTSIFGGHLFLREFDVDIDVHDTNIYIEGLIGVGFVNGIFNAIIQSISQDVIQNEISTISQVITDVLFDVIDDVLRNFTLADIMG